MAGQLTQAGANRAVQAGVGQAVAASAAMYVALSTALPASPDTATLASFAALELTTAGYSRQPVTWTVPVGDPSYITNAGIVTFGPYTEEPPLIVTCFLCDTSIGTSGEVLAYWTLNVSRDPAVGDSSYFAVGDLTMTLD